MKSVLLSLLIITIVCLASPFVALAGTAIPPPQTAPFDGGLSLLLAAGVAYASKKAYDKRKKTKENGGIQK